MDMLTGFRRDLMHAVRSLAKARAFTFVCVVSLGVGMTPVIVPYAFRMFTAPPLGLDTTSLVEVVTTNEGPRRETSRWSYPDLLALQQANTGATLTGWSMVDVDVMLSRSVAPSAR